MIRIAVCDYKIKDLESTYKQILAYLNKRGGEEFLVRRFQSVYDLLECLENPNLYFNMYFLDVEMPIYTGIEVGQLIRKDDESAAIVYTATTKDGALEALATSPIQYMLKPVRNEQLVEVLEAAIRHVQQSVSKKLLIKRKEGLSNVGLHQIEYVEYRDHALSFHLNDGRVIASRVIQQSFSWVFENTLDDPRFIKPHSSYAVNMDRVMSIGAKEFEMESGAVIPISRRIYANVKQQYVDYMVTVNGATII